MSDSQVPQPPRHLGDDRGFILIEVLVSAIMLVTISLAVFAALSKADTLAGQQQQRALAANVAQSELEKIRSLPVEDIAALRGDRSISYSGKTYAINTVAKWVTDGADEPECSTRTGGLDYLRVTVTVKFPQQAGATPVTFTSLVTPSAGAGGGDTGSVSVHIQDRNAGPVQAITVVLDGPTSFTGVTNVNGCVVFGFVPEGDYTVRFQKGGYVDRNSVNKVADPTTVVGGQTNKLVYDYDVGGTTKVKFLTRVGGSAATATDVPTNPANFSFFNAGQDTPVVINMAANATDWDGTVGPTPLFPFASPYSVYAGACNDKNSVPTTAISAGDQQVPRSVNIPAGAFQNTGSVWLPSFDLTVNTGTSGSPGTGANNVVVQYDTACAPIWQRRTVATGNTGKLPDTGFPYSTAVRVCAMGYDKAGVFRKVNNPATPLITNTRFNYSTAYTLYLQSGTAALPTITSCF